MNNLIKITLSIFVLSLIGCAKNIRFKENKIITENEYTLFDKQVFSSYQKNFNDILERPKILMPTLEYTYTSKEGHEQYSYNISKEGDERSITSTKGGLGTVTADLANVMPKYLKSHFNEYEVAFLVPLFEKKQLKKIYKTYTINMGQNNEIAQIFENIDINGNKFYFISSDIFYKIGKSIYAPNNADMIYSFILFGKITGKFIADYQPNIIHYHENTAAYSYLYSPNYISTVLQVHNSGFYYNHLIKTPLKDTVSSLGVDSEIYEQFFKQTINTASFFNLQLVSRLIANYNLLSVLTVSPEYAQEIKMTYKDIENKIFDEKKLPMTEPFNMDPYNGWVNYEVVDGVYNGLFEGRKPINDRFLKKWEDGESDENIIDEVKKEWTTDLNFKFDKDDTNSFAGVVEAKKKLKKMLQLNFNLEVNTDTPIFSVISRIDAQKKLTILVKNIPYILKNGGQVIVAGEGNDNKTIEKLKELQKSYPKQVYFHNKFVKQRLKSLILGGSDFFVMPSAFEPCGIVDIENYWYGNIGILHKVGGLQKNSQSIFYAWQDFTDIKGETSIAQKAFRQAFDLFNTKVNSDNKDRLISDNEFRKKQIHGLSMDFKWEKSIDEYFDIYRSTSIFKILMCLSDKECAPSNKSSTEIYDMIIQSVPKSTLKKFLFLAQQKNEHTTELTNFIKFIEKSI